MNVVVKGYQIYFKANLRCHKIIYVLCSFLKKLSFNCTQLRNLYKNVYFQLWRY